ncbi:MAG: hypothetical protein KF777_03505 [Planctomycetaceae bacterium]|nr:hypothetical protein [Planctomycetaceae bacterium]
MSESAAEFKPDKATLAVEYKHERPLTACHWDPLGRFVYFGAEDHLVHRYDVATKMVTPLAGHDSWVRGLASSPDGEVFYSAGYDGRLMVWGAADAAPVPRKIVEAHPGWIRAVAASPDGKFVATCGNDRFVRLWSRDGERVLESPGHTSHVYNVIFSADSSTVFSCDQKGVVRRLSVATGESSEVLTVAALHGYDTTFRADIGGARGIGLSHDGNFLGLGGIINVTNAFAGVGEIAVALVNLQTGELVRVLESKDKTKGTVWGVAQHPSNRWLAVSGGGGGGWLHGWTGDEANEFGRLNLKNDGRGMSLSRDGSQLAVAHADKHLRIYQL